MTTYHGVADNGQASGPVIVSIAATGIVTGSVKLGAPPKASFTGFAGRLDGAGFIAAGANKTTNDPADIFDDIRLATRVAGTVNADGSVTGTINATVNGVPQPPFAFRATSAALASSSHANGGGSMLAPTIEDGGYLEKASGAYSMVPTWAKLGLAGVAGYALYKRFMR